MKGILVGADGSPLFASKKVFMNFVILVMCAQFAFSLLAMKGESKLLSSNEVLDQAMQIRKPYLLPLHLLQAELMKRRRAYLVERQAEHTPVDHALMVSIAGIAAGLRNTG